MIYHIYFDMHKKLFVTLTLLLSACGVYAQRNVNTLNEGWQFTKGDGITQAQWQAVRIPHDWAISGPFDINNDIQYVAVEQNGETEASCKTGRTGGLPFIGKGCYKTVFKVDKTEGRSITLVFDGAMSNAHVKVNGQEVAYWPYGYNSFHTCIDHVVKEGENSLEVSLENFERASRWYPGAGLYRNVHVVSTSRVHIPVWGTYVTTPDVTREYASVHLEMEISGARSMENYPYGEKIMVRTVIIGPDGKEAASQENPYIARGQKFAQNFLVAEPELWSPEHPALYTAKTTLIVEGEEVDCYNTRFGIRELRFIPEKGFFLNGVPTKFKGVCNHHDLGPLGAAVNRSALRHQVELLKDMGANAIRTSHNMPAPELVELCDEMGMMLMVEAFDDWSYRPKSENGYGRFFNDWACKDVTNMVKHYRNNPSVVMWSIGNEICGQWSPVGMSSLVMLQDLVHSLDPTRPVTCGNDQKNAVLETGFAAAFDIPGFNYKPQFYEEAYAQLPQRMILGTETASTVSSRGVYHFDSTSWDDHNCVMHDDNQSSSYDNEACPWSNTPDLDFARDADHDWVLGQFVWTGFDYLGEPSPYDTNAWPSHSSVFGIIDLASLPKDRYYLYRSVWNEKDATLHVLPHWNWKGREGKVTPVFVYTSYPEAELFINGKSQGRRSKNDSSLQHRFRLMWNEIVYEPGELKVVAYDDSGKAVAEKIVKTAGKPHHLVLKSNRSALEADGDELAYITVQVADKDGNIVPDESRRVRFSVEGAGKFEATANGDPTCLLPFQNPEMDLFSGAATAIVRSAKTPGQLKFTASAHGLKSASITIPVE